LRSSTRHRVSSREPKVRHCDGARSAASSAEAARGATRAADIAKVSLGLGERVAGVVAEDVLEGRVGMEVALERSGCADGAEATTVHHRDAIAESVGLLHVVRP
jgi:hypothetical protein